MLILGVDSSLSLLSVALLRNDRLAGAVALEGSRSRNEKLLPAVDWLLAEGGVARTEIDLFAVTRGPGSFTGVRIGLATVQGMALALGRPVCAMSTHEAIALGCGEGPEPVLVVDDAGRGELYVSRFERGREVTPPHLASGDMATEEPAGRRVVVSEFLQRHNVAACCAIRAGRISASGMLLSYIDATPIYVRLAEAEVKLQQKR